jgi:hypothetical protein|tara:strand:+ start:466 stop:693 length:228 start_codon:yes stop_codon:yes gene_type:complete
MIKLSQPWMNHGITYPIGTTFEPVKKIKRGTIYSFSFCGTRGETLVENGNVPGGTITDSLDLPNHWRSALMDNLD